MHITHRQLRAFIMVAEAGSFSLASQRLHLTPSAVSLLIRELETTLDFRLLERTTRRVLLTPAGREFMPSANAVLKELQQAEIRAQDLRNAVRATVRVAAPLVIAAALLPPALARCQEEFPHAVVRIIDVTVDQLIEAVADGRAELAIGPDRPAIGGVERQALFVSRWVAWCPPGHPLEHLSAVRWEDLAGLPVIMPGHDYQFYISLLLQTLAPNLRITPTHVVEQMTTALGLAAAGLGVALGPEYAVPVARAWPLVMRPLAPPGVERDICLYTSPSRLLPEAAAVLLPRLVEVLRRTDLL